MTEGKLHEFCIWDDSAQRLHAMEAGLRVALHEAGIRGQVMTNCEPPLLARNQLTGTTPAIQCDDGEFWRHTIGEAVTAKQFSLLLKKLKALGQL